MVDVNNVAAKISFTYQSLFNAVIRDMNPENQNPENSSENFALFMKGAPERVLPRCTKILSDGVPVKISTDIRVKTISSYERLSGYGERVIAFAYTNLDERHFKKEPKPFFDVKGWSSWKEVRSYNPKILGWFPMWKLTFIGLVSLSDPPQPGIRKIVRKCKTAGIKVIMVTGDDPICATTVAH